MLIFIYVNPNHIIYPLVNEHSYRKWPLVVDIPIQNGDFSQFLFKCLPERIHHHSSQLITMKNKKEQTKNINHKIDHWSNETNKNINHKIDHWSQHETNKRHQSKNWPYWSQWNKQKASITKLTILITKWNKQKASITKLTILITKWNKQKTCLVLCVGCNKTYSCSWPAILRGPTHCHSYKVVLPQL